MAHETFVCALEWAVYFHEIYGHGELNLAGIGESTLHPRLAEYTHLAREALGWGVELVLATNGLLVDDALARDLAGAKPKVWVSLHRPEKCVPAVAALKRYGLLAGVSSDGALQSIDWAGQVKYPVTTPAKGSPCPWHRQGWAMVLADGRVTRCCLDATGDGVLGNVLDDDLAELQTNRWALCETCHLT